MLFRCLRIEFYHRHVTCWSGLHEYNIYLSYTDKKFGEIFPQMWGRDQVQSHIEGKISQNFFPQIEGKISLVNNNVWTGPRFDSRAWQKKVNCFPFNEENVCFWTYPQLFMMIKSIVVSNNCNEKNFSEQGLNLQSSDYQPMPIQCTTSASPKRENISLLKILNT